MTMDGLTLGLSLLRPLDWAVLAAYAVLLAATGIWFSRRKQENTEGYFLAGRRMPVWAVAISIIATSLSAATFIGAPQLSYVGDLTYLSTTIGMFIAVLVVAYLFIPVFYRHKVTSIYELLEVRFGRGAKKSASAAFMLGRVLASGSRIFIAAIPLSLLMFGDSGDVPPSWQLVAAIFVLSLIGVLYTLAGGIETVIWTEVFQTAVLVVSVLAAIVLLFHRIPAGLPELTQVLETAGPNGASKLTLLDTGVDSSSRFFFDPSRQYTLLTAVFAFTLLGLASYGTDHDLVQRMLTCKNAVAGGRSVIMAILISLPIVSLFMLIGLLLYIFYQRPDVMGESAPGYPVNDSRKIFLTFILREMPAGMSGLMIAGLMSVAISSLASALNAMSATAIRDFYRHMRPERNERHYVFAGRVGVAAWGAILAGFACFCVVWQRVSDLPLIDFALSVMNFAYAGLLAVFVTAIFTRRGSNRSAVAALIAGFLAVLAMQPPVWNRAAALFSRVVAGPDEAVIPAMNLAFPWQLVIATSIATFVCCLGRREGGERA